jgi:quercetin dioxygenase-like cupin family protein
MKSVRQDREMIRSKALVLACMVAAAPLSAARVQDARAQDARAQEARAQEPLRTIMPGSLNLTKTPVGPGVFDTTVLGDPAQGGKLYVLYVKYTAGARSAPHTHPDERTVTVVSGTFYAGAGEKFDDARLTPLRPGSIIVIPAGAPHYGWAKEGEVILQEAGLGPSGTTLMPK